MGGFLPRSGLVQQPGQVRPTGLGPRDRCAPLGHLPGTLSTYNFMDKSYKQLESGWLVHDKEMFEYFVKNTPPRNGVFLKQFISDLKGFNTLVLILGSITCIIISIFQNQLSLLFLGVMILFIYLSMFLKVTLSDRSSELKIGYIDSLKQHEKYSHLSTSRARVNENDEIPVVFETEPADKIVKECGKAQVIFLYNPKDQYSSVLGITAVPLTNKKEA